MHKKYSIGIILIAIYIVFLFTIPPLVFEKSVTPILAGITVIMVAIYVLLGLDIIHRTVIAMFGAILSIILAIVLGSMVAEDSLHFVIESVDFNTIGLLLGMMIMVAILGETGVFHQVGIKLGKISKGNVWILMLLLCSSVARVITTPLRDMFAALFFISIGALMDISLVPFFLIPGLILIAVSVSSKFILVSGILSIAKYGKTTALRTGIGMSAARGELSLVVVKAGQDVGVISNSVFPVLGVVTIITTFITPYLLRLGKTIKFDSGSDDGSSSSTESGKDEDHPPKDDNI